MNTFKDQCQEQRRQRQQEIAVRQQHVRGTLTTFQQERQAQASQLRSDLSLFQQELKQETHSFLTNTSEQRQAQAQQLAQLLHTFVKTLQDQTAQFVAATASDRSLMAQRLTQELSHYHTHLIASVGALRQGLQIRIKELQTETRTLLKTNQEKRLRTQIQLAKDLTLFVETLRSDVQTYLFELELLRQDRAQQLQQMLKQDRKKRLIEMDRLFQEFAEFRAALHQYCVDLQALTWGATESLRPQSSSPPVASSPVSLSIIVQPQAEILVPESNGAKVAIAPVSVLQPQLVEPQPAEPQPAEPRLVEPLSVDFPQPAKPQRPRADVSPTVQPHAVPSEPAVEMLPVSTTKASLQKDAAQLEEEIYSHIRQVQGARLTELETALDINRFQAVDALRSLIKKGLITQRDRIYLIQEEISL